MPECKKLRAVLQTAIAAALAGCLMNSATLAQSSKEPPKALAFDAATIKLSPSGDRDQRHSGGPDTDSPTLYRQTQATISDMIRVAWNVSRPTQILSGTPIDRDWFEVVARIPQGVTRDEFREMLRNLLAERLALKAHEETREFPGYEMVVIKAGLKVKEAIVNPPAADAASVPADGKTDWRTLKPGEPGVLGSFSIQDGFHVARWQFQLQTFAQVSRVLEGAVGSPIADRTGLAGKYTFAVEYSQELPRMTSEGPPPTPDVFEELRSQVGVELVKSKLPLRVVVVDSVSRVPTEN